MSIRTATLADVYAQQGHLDEALAIYESLLAERPDDEELRARRDGLLLLLDAEEVAARLEARVDRLRELLRRIRGRRHDRASAA